MSSRNFQKAFLNNFTIFITLKGNKIILHQVLNKTRNKLVTKNYSTTMNIRKKFKEQSTTFSKKIKHDDKVSINYLYKEVRRIRGYINIR